LSFVVRADGGFEMSRALQGTSIVESGLLLPTEISEISRWNQEVGSSCRKTFDGRCESTFFTHISVLALALIPHFKS